jgi:peptide-methionine (R)-S-oxide reductase
MSDSSQHQEDPPNPATSSSLRSSLRPNRRAFLISASGACAALALWSLHRSSLVSAATHEKNAPAEVTIVQFGPDGKPIGKVVLPRVIKSDADWRSKLPAISYDVTRHADTEAPGTGSLLEEHGHGIFRCICCDTALFSSETKFDSGTGWPSFWQPIASENVLETSDRTMFMVRTAVSCRLCDAHLGHVFDDGPRPTLRYCMNSAAMRFAKLA